MNIKVITLSRSGLVGFAAGAGFAGIVAMGSAYAASQSSNTAILPISNLMMHHQATSSLGVVPLINVADNNEDSDSKTSSSGMKDKQAKRTNQATGAAGANPGAMSQQKGNQPKSATKSN